jgi:hypothetical protein
VAGTADRAAMVTTVAAPAVMGDLPMCRSPLPVGMIMLTGTVTMAARQGIARIRHVYSNSTAAAMVWRHGGRLWAILASDAPPITPLAGANDSNPATHTDGDLA